MELVNFTSYRSNDGHSTDGEGSSKNRKLIQGRNLPVYLLQDGPLPGIPRGKKLVKKAPKLGNNNSNQNNNVKTFVPIDTTRTDFSKQTSEPPLLQIDSHRTDESALNMSFGTSQTLEFNFTTRNTPHLNLNFDTPHQDDLEMLTPAVNDMSKSIISPHRNGLTQSELAQAHLRAMGKDATGGGGGAFKIRRNSNPRIEDGGKAYDSAPPSRRATTRISSVLDESRTDPGAVKRSMENLEYEPNPDVAPYQPANFMRQNTLLPFPLKRSSTILKKVPIPKRHLDTFGGYEYNFMGKRGVMLHTDRYQVDFIKSFDGMTQRERLQAGLNYVEAMRGTKRRRELVPHRAQLDLILGGKQIEFEERFYLSRELQKLKALAMPDVAKDLYHGRGIHLPINHNSLKPRYPVPNDIEDECMASAPSSLQSVLRRNENQHDFPRIDRDPTFLGRGSQLRTKSTLNRNPPLPSIRGRMDNGFEVIRTGRLPPRGSKSWPFPVSKSSERRTVTTLSARLGLGHRLNHDVTSLSRSHTQAPPPSRDEVPGQPQSLLTKGRSGISTQRKISPAVDVPVVENQILKESEGERTSQPPATSSHDPQRIVEGSSESHIAPNISLSDGASVEVPSGPGVVLGAANEAPPSSQSRVRPGTEEGVHRTTPNPLRGGDMIQSVSQDEQEELRQTFQRLDTDMDGHLKYNQLKTQLPQAFSWEQERFIEEVYNLTNSITFFGVDEFMAMDRLSKTVEALTGKAKEAYSSLDFASIPDELLKYVGKFDVADSGNHGTISIDALQRILSETISPTLTTDRAVWDEVIDTISTDYGTKITKIGFIAHIPLFLSLQKDFK